MPIKTSIENIKRIQDIYDRMDKQSVGREELDQLVQLSADLHEKAVILRYKAAEERIFGTEEPKEPVTVVEEVVQAELPNLNEIDFSIFEEKEPVVAEELFEEEPVVEEERVEEEAAAEEILVEEEIVVEEEVAETPEPIELDEEPVSTSSLSPAHFEKVLKEHATGLQTPLSAISGSFGLNERILYINELFDGEAEKFSACVQKLDKIADWTDCVQELIKVSSVENWDMDSDTTDEFILHVNRKYA